jgi:hypothetical protein
MSTEENLNKGIRILSCGMHLAGWSASLRSPELVSQIVAGLELIPNSC